VSELKTVELKAFVPSKDFALSKQFYQDLSFTLGWSSDDLAYFRCDNSCFCRSSTTRNMPTTS
jgi:hypothetical protein